MEKTELKSLLGAIVDSLPANRKSQEDDETPKNYCESFTPFSWTPNVELSCANCYF